MGTGEKTIETEWEEVGNQLQGMGSLETSERGEF